MERSDIKNVRCPKCQKGDPGPKCQKTGPKMASEIFGHFCPLLESLKSLLFLNGTLNGPFWHSKMSDFKSILDFLVFKNFRKVTRVQKCQKMGLKPGLEIFWHLCSLLEIFWHFLNDCWMDLPVRSYSFWIGRTAGYDKVMKCAIENSTYALPFSFIFLSALLQYLAHCKSLLSKVLTVRTSWISQEGLLQKV